MSTDRSSLNRPGVLIKEIPMADVEDPYLYAAFPLSDWEKTEEYAYIKSQVGKDNMVFYCDSDPNTFGFKIRIYAPLQGQALTFYRLKYGTKQGVI